jgi:PAS domain S-box-containing protein
MPDPVRDDRRRVENDVKSTAGKRKLEPFKRGAKECKKAPDLFGQKEELFLSIAKHTTDVIMIVDARCKILYINDAGSRLIGKIAPGDNAFAFLHAESQNQCKQALDESITTDKRVIVEHTGPESTWWLTRFIPIKEFGYPVPAAVIICTDITDHKRMEEQLIKLNRALRVVGRCNEILVRSSDEGHFLNDACRAIVEVEGYSLVWVGLAESDETRTVRPVAHAGFEDGYLETVNVTWAETERGRGPTGTAIRTGTPQVMRDIVHDPNYAPWRDEALKRGYSSSVALTMISEGRAIGALNVYSAYPDAFGPKEVKLLMELASDLAYGINALRNNAERDRMTKELLEHENKLKVLTMELTLAEERERRRIAAGIHDDISQGLVMTKFELQKLEHAVSDPGISGTLNSLCDRLDEMMEDAYLLTFELSNPLLHTIGLGAAVESWLEQQVRNKHGINYDFASNLSTLCLDLEVRITLFQAIRDLLTNVIEHARAKNVKVSIRDLDDRVQIAVKDDGIGFDATEVLETPSVGAAGHFGLFNVRERIDYLGGNFDVLSASGQGTRITITVTKKYSAPIQTTHR